MCGLVCRDPQENARSAFARSPRVLRGRTQGRCQSQHSPATRVLEDDLKFPVLKTSGQKEALGFARLHLARGAKNGVLAGPAMESMALEEGHHRRDTQMVFGDSPACVPHSFWAKRFGLTGLRRQWVGIGDQAEPHLRHVSDDAPRLRLGRIKALRHRAFAILPRPRTRSPKETSSAPISAAI